MVLPPLLKKKKGGKEMKLDQKLQGVIASVAFIGGIVLLIAALALDFMGSAFEGRGAMLVIGILAILFGMYLFPTEKHHRKLINIIFLFPLLFTFLVTVIIPLLLGFYYSFTDWDGIRIRNYVGFENYTKMFHQPSFVWSILLTFLFVLLNMICVNLIAFLLALLCTNKFKGIGFFRASYFVPNLIGGIVLGYIWQFIFSNVLVQFTSKVFDNNYSILSNSNTAFIGIIVVYIWQYAGYIMLIYITGLNTVPGEVLEAAAIDGASPLQTLFNIKIPMIAPSITICTFLTLTNSFKMFDVNLSLTGGKGSIASFMDSYLTNGTEMLALNIYNEAVIKSNYAIGQAKAVLFFIILATVSIIQVRISNKKEVEL